MLGTLRIFGRLSRDAALLYSMLLLMALDPPLRAATVGFEAGSQEILLPLSQGEFEIGYLNEDSYIDILVTYEGIVTRYLNDGRGIFNQSQVILEGEQISQIELADLDGDGDSDYWITDPQGSTSSWLGQEDGTLVLLEKRGSSGLPVGTSFGDFDGDGDLDALASIPAYVVTPIEPGRSGFRLYLNGGDGSFALGPFLFSSETVARELTLGDLDGDQDLDFISLHADHSLRVWINDGEGGFMESDQRLQLESSGKLHSIELGDFDSDDDLDIILPEESGQNWLWTNRGDGTFDDLPTEFSPFLPILASGDFDNDLDLDLVATGSGCQDCGGLWLQDGEGLTLNGSSVFDANSQVHQLEVIDIDADGDRDLVVLIDIVEAPAGRTVVSTWLNSFIDLSLQPTNVGKIVDPTLSEVIRQTLGLPLDLAVSPDYSTLRRLELSRSDFGEFFNPIRSLEGLEEADQIEHLSIEGVLEPDRETGELDLRFLETWTQMKSLSLRGNGIVRLRLPQSWTGLEVIHLDDNLLSDVSFLRDFPQLSRVTLSGNEISQFSYPDASMKLQSIDLDGNPLIAVEIGAGIREFSPAVAELRASDVKVSVNGRLTIDATSIPGKASLQYLGDIGTYAVRRSVDFIHWTVIDEITVEVPVWPAVTFAVDMESDESNAFYSIARLSP